MHRFGSWLLKVASLQIFKLAVVDGVQGHCVRANLRKRLWQREEEILRGSHAKPCPGHPKRVGNNAWFRWKKSSRVCVVWRSSYTRKDRESLLLMEDFHVGATKSQLQDSGLSHCKARRSYPQKSSNRKHPKCSADGCDLTIPHVLSQSSSERCRIFSAVCLWDQKSAHVQRCRFKVADSKMSLNLLPVGDLFFSQEGCWTCLSGWISSFWFKPFRSFKSKTLCEFLWGHARHVDLVALCRGCGCFATRAWHSYSRDCHGCSHPEDHWRDGGGKLREGFPRSSLHCQEQGTSSTIKR